MVAPRWGVQWLPDIPTNPLTSVVHLKWGSTSSSKVTEESNLAPYIHKGWTKIATWKITHTLKTDRGQHRSTNETYMQGKGGNGKLAPRLTANPEGHWSTKLSIRETDGSPLTLPESWELGETPEQKSWN